VYFCLQSIYLACTLRLYRGQPLSSQFFNQMLLPISLKLIFASVLFGVMAFGGTLLVVLPGIAVLALYSFMPFLLLDRRGSIIQAMNHSRVLLTSNNAHGLAPALGLCFMYVCGMALIALVPLVLPLYAAAMAELYEELSAS
jgi:uncharacterized membrane protein